jgi:biopolymer transport protein TolQ
MSTALIFHFEKTTMTPETSIFSFMLNASLPVKLVIILLILASMVSWTMIFQRWFFFKRAREDIKAFEDRFWSDENLGNYYQELHEKHDRLSGQEHIFYAGFREFSRLNHQKIMSADAIMEGTQRAMRVALAREIDKLEKHLSFLATVGSTSPYVGLFGTVWGIMNAFRSLGAVQQATIAMVAPGISEALITTAIGLFAAIPAVIAYNRYANDVETLTNQYDTFKEEFASILHRQTHASSSQITE